MWWVRRIRALGHCRRWHLRPSRDTAGSPVSSLPRRHRTSSDIGSSDHIDTRLSRTRRCCPSSCTSGNELCEMDADSSMRSTQYDTPQSTTYKNISMRTYPGALGQRRGKSQRIKPYQAFDRGAFIHSQLSESAMSLSIS